MLKLTWEDVKNRAALVAARIRREYPRANTLRAYAIPNGGIPAALAIAQHCPEITLVEDPAQASIFLDDLIDSGQTRERLFAQYGAHPFYALWDKTQNDPPHGTWVSFPWERAAKQEGPEDNIVRLLQFIGEDPDREGLRQTPARVVRSYRELFSGYKQDVASMLTTFEDVTCDEMVVLRNIEFTSCCEHHLLPFIGSAHIAYIPDGKVVGISKLARLLEVYTRRLQIQERICEQVTTSLMEHLHPKGAACVLESRHLCMVCRGVQKQQSVMVTSSLKGVFLKPEVRQEFFHLVRSH